MIYIIVSHYYLSQTKLEEWLICVRHVTLLTSDWSNLSLRSHRSRLTVVTIEMNTVKSQATDSNGTLNPGLVQTELLAS